MAQMWIRSAASSLGNRCFRIPRWKCFHSSGVAKGLTIRDMLIYSSHLEDVVDTTRKSSRKPLLDAEILKLKLENEKLKSSLNLDEKSNLSVAVPFIYGEDINLERTVKADEIVMMEGKESEKEDTEAPVYPFNLYHNPRDYRDYKFRLESGLKDEKTMPDYEASYDESGDSQPQKLLGTDEMFRYGSYDVEIPASKVPCGSCGALLHCQDPKMPGFMPKELFKRKSDRVLRSSICQRCYILREYKVALKVSVPPDFYPQTLKDIHLKPALILLIVDLLDFPGSVWPGILELLGPNKRIILVGNKIDLLPQDSNNYMKRVEDSMKKVFLEKCNKGAIVYDPQKIHTMLVSARSKFNIEKLINLVYRSWNESRLLGGADIYLLGTTNVGKSSIFNCLLESDMCKIKAVDCVEKAMTSPIPGTTLNLLKFPIMRPDPSRLQERFARLRRSRHYYRAVFLERISMLRKTGDRTFGVPKGEVGLTFRYKLDKQLPLTTGLFQLSQTRNVKVTLPKRLDPLDPDFADGKWCYDTPGTVSKDQITNLLTQDEIREMACDLPLIPRTYAIRNGQTLFIAGLARFDILKGIRNPHSMLITVFCADKLPINVVRTSEAEEFYREALGTEILGIPRGSNVRLREFPELRGEVFDVDGYGINRAACDIVLSSAGWITCCPNLGRIIKIKAWTPAGKGIYLRDPSFLPYAHHLRGQRIGKSLAHKNDKVFIPNTFY